MVKKTTSVAVTDEALAELKAAEEAAIAEEIETNKSYGDPEDKVNEDLLSEELKGLVAKYPDGVPLHVLNAISSGTYKG